MAKRAKLPNYKHECAMPGCSAMVEIDWKFCLKHRGWYGKKGPPVRRASGSFGGGSKG